MKGKLVATLLAATPSLIIIGTGLAPVPAAAQEQPRYTFHVAAGSLAAALRAVSTASGRSIAGPADLLAGKAAPALDGRYTVEAAVDQLLAGSGLRARAVGDALVIEADPRGRDVASPTPRDDIVVTGSRIGGAKSASPVVVVGREAMRDAGRTSVDDVIRAIPQNFSGGQNPGVGSNVPERNGTNVGGSSSVNLRGLGSDATLTLLDGHRLAYSAALQSVDIAAIPFGAIDRIEIVPDGASTLYGSDAVAGVVNVILRRDFSGLETSAKLGASTDGGYFVQQYGATAGARWSGGSAMLAYEYDGNTAITSSDRRYVAAVRPGLTLLPALRQNNAALVATQRIVPGLTLSLDALVGQRNTDRQFPLNAAGVLSISASTILFRSRSLSLASSLDWSPLPGWLVTLSGTFGANKVGFTQLTRVGATTSTAGTGYYRNRGSSAELSGAGPLATLPGGSAKAAFGFGWRRADFFRFTGNPLTTINHVQDSYYAFGELNLPLLRPLTVSGALRYERYPGVGEVVTPKVGAIFTLSSGVDLKASWGRSFRAPTLYQQYQPQFAYLVPGTTVGGSGLPTTALLATGGNANLKPERSSNWSATLDFHPPGLAGLDVSLSYFSVDYRDRIVTPILFTSQALTKPIYADFVARSPTAADQSAFIAQASTFTNITGATYNPANVVAIVRNTSVNAGRQEARGVDALLTYKTRAGPGAFNGSVDISYLDSQQQLSVGQPVTPLSGVLFNPPRLKGRAQLGYAIAGVSITGDVTYIGPVRDTRTTRAIRIAGMTPVDLTIRYKSRGRGVLGGLDIILSAQNLFDDKPTIIATTGFADTPYDSTNYTPFGRVVSLSFAKRW